MVRRRSVIGLVGLALAVMGVVPAGAQDLDGHYQDFGDPGGFLNIVPPGQDGVVNGAEALQIAAGGGHPEHVADQLPLYGDLVYEVPGLTEDELLDWFKDASFGVAPDDIDRVYQPGDRDDVTVIRDASFGVPHVFGDTREGTMFAAGYTGAEDRLFLMDVLRHVGRARLSEFLGPSPANEQMDLEQLVVAPYRDADLTAQAEAIRASGPEGAQIAADAEAYAAGVNQYITEALTDPTKLPAEYPALQQLPEEWIVEDTIAIASLVGGIFGKGGGGELRNLCGSRQADGTWQGGLVDLEVELGSADEARAVFDDLHFANEPDAPTSASGTFEYMTDLGPVDPDAVPELDCDSLEPIVAGEPGLTDVVDAIVGAIPEPPIPLAATGASSPGRGGRVDAPWGSFNLDFSMGMSNALLVDGDHTATGRPIAVFGPQTGYFTPQLLVEKDLHGPGIDARGVAFAGTDIFIQLGRGRDYAWSATSASGDNVDTWVLQLCEEDGSAPTVDSLGYLHDGQCLPIERFNHTQVAKPSAGGMGSPGIIFNQRVERTELYGPVLYRGQTTDGTPIAVTTDRSTYSNELGSAPGFFRVNDPDFMTDGFESFRQAMGAGIDFTFNWFYIDDRHIGYQHSCKCPQRADGVDPYLPVWGTGEWDWQGDIGFEQQPNDLDPEDGYLTSWNNKQAPGFRSNDRQFSYGPVYRSLLLDRRVERAMAKGPVDRADLVDAMELAGTTDLRAQEVLPDLLDLMGDDPPAGVDDRAGAMYEVLAAWAADDHGHRWDADHDGAYEHAQAVAIMDAWWLRVTHAMFDERSGNAIDNLGLLLVDSPMLHIGSAFNGGFESHVEQDLRQVRGDPGASFSRTYCGGGDPANCAADLWASLDEAAADLDAEFASPEVEDWQRVPADDAIRHSAVALAPVAEMHWVNRPTFQQVVQIGAPTRRPPGPSESPSPSPGVSPTGGATETTTATGTASTGTSGSPTPTTGSSPLVVAFGAALMVGALLGRRRR